jgi:PleD family two-component response regulator
MHGQVGIEVLAADDNPISQTVLRSMLQNWGTTLSPLPMKDQAWQVLHSPERPSMAILDWMMPGTDGVEICRQLRASGAEPYTYILLFTSRSDLKDVVEALDAGADDYLRSLLILPNCVPGCEPAAASSNCSNSSWRQEELRLRAAHDGLTGLLNRSAIMEILPRELARCSRKPANFHRHGGSG